MTLCGLSRHNHYHLAYEIALNHIQSVARVFQETGTLWENYAPEFIQHGKPAGREFVGWTGVSAINILIEYVIGIQPGNGDIDLSWHLHLTERHGVLRYPLGRSNRVDLICEKRLSHEDPPTIMIRTHQPLTLEVTWSLYTRRLTLDAGEHHIQL